MSFEFKGDCDGDCNKDRKSLNDTHENVAICKEYYLNVFLNIATKFHSY